MEDTTQSKAYATDLAYIHDAGFGGFARAAAQFVLQTLTSTRADKRFIVELGCGSGITAEILMKAGHDILGIDISAAMIELARSRVPGAKFQQMSLLDVEFPRCDAVIAIGEVLNYLFDEKLSSVRLGRFFEDVFAALRPGGFLLFDGAEPGRAPGPGPTKGFTEGEGWICLYSAEEDPAHQRLTRSIITFRKLGDDYRRENEVHTLRLFDRAEICSQLQSHGFVVQVLDEYIDLHFPPGYVGILAKKP